MTIAIGADPHGFELKEAVRAHLATRGFDILDVGAHTSPQEAPFYRIAQEVARHVSPQAVERALPGQCEQSV